MPNSKKDWIDVFLLPRNDNNFSKDGLILLIDHVENLATTIKVRLPLDPLDFLEWLTTWYDETNCVLFYQKIQQDSQDKLNMSDLVEIKSAIRSHLADKNSFNAFTANDTVVYQKPKNKSPTDQFDL